MRIKSNMAARLLPVLPFMFVSLIFLSGCKEPTNDSQSYIPLTGVWEGTIDWGDSLILELVEVLSDSIFGDIIISDSSFHHIYNIRRGERMVNDSPDFHSESKIGYLYLSGFIADSIISGNYFHLIFNPPDEGTWWAIKVNN